MTPGARCAAAAEILDRWLAGEPAEKILTNWSRASRFAGSKDRAAVRDLVFSAIRRRRSSAVLGHGETGRALVLGYLRSTGQDPEELFSGIGHAPDLLTDAERQPPRSLELGERLDCPDWLLPECTRSLGEERDRTLEAMRDRAPVYLRANLARTSRQSAVDRLAVEDIVTRPHPLSPSALEAVEGARRVQGSACYRDGLVEIQDAASQAVSDAIPLPDAGAVLDYCAGGGGKTLALAARGAGPIFAHDADPRRMKDLPTRAARAGASVERLSGNDVARHAPYALVVADVPCSGSGAWRRQPEARWRLEPDMLEGLLALQREIVDDVAPFVAPGGALAYVTCSMFRSENEDQADWFLKRDGWAWESGRRFSPLEGGDGFFLAVFRRNA
ncbi:16S rRNA (cytosine967-C5)-methyltransferase [Aliiruegeria haliotis]|uniref:16S rRNA (Cytosine967-C5)-methyltransferase n=1 Tax=Aliiruegeria haliotis TaxID=1280846 RepID=A0A2T0S0T4_9RHOB|nr:RsmB/NOP family class I SAM-dependent RNA methyltransferase [Aliiruegeria haliotis]PRY26982.1 16S rRNA (cytosine967-C5)-methyltransferase [Aliiruegeria haliotis]